MAQRKKNSHANYEIFIQILFSSNRVKERVYGIHKFIIWHKNYLLGKGKMEPKRH